MEKLFTRLRQGITEWTLFADQDQEPVQ